MTILDVFFIILALNVLFIIIRSVCIYVDLDKLKTPLEVFTSTKEPDYFIRHDENGKPLYSRGRWKAHSRIVQIQGEKK